MPSATIAGLAVGFNSRKSAAAPVTCGDAIEVPLCVYVALSLVTQAEAIPLPGANISTQAPKFEKLARWSELLVAPTVIAFGARAGE